MKSKHLLIALMAMVALSSCDVSPTLTADQKDTDNQEKLQSEGNRQIGMPNIHNFQEKKMVKMLYELRDNPNLINYCYTYSEVSGKLQFIGKCIGYAMPYATQFSNPQKYTRVSITGGTTYLAMPQAEPNGLFMPASADGTWVMLINPKDGQPVPVYLEPKVVVSPFPLN